MTTTDYYKSLISDEEVIRALIKESKARDGELMKEKTRLRPNLNFFQRTVTNLVSSNKKLRSNQEDIHTRVITKQEDIIKNRRGEKYFGKIKTPHVLMREILLTNKIKFVNSSETYTSVCNEIKAKEGINVIRLHDDLEKDFVNSDSEVNSNQQTSSFNKTVKAYKKHCRQSSDSSDISIVSISGVESVSRSNVVIELSDTNSSEPSRKAVKGKRITKLKHKKCKEKRKKKDLR